MEGLAVLCTSCKKLFFVDMPMFKGNGTVEFTGSNTNCPKCRKQAWIVDGEYVLKGDVLKRVDPINLKDLFKLGIEEIVELKRVFEEIKNSDISKEEIKERIKEEVPSASFLLKYLPKTSEALAAWVTAIVALLTFIFIYCKNNDPKVVNNIQQKITVNNYFGNEETKKEKEKVGRNEPCPCGSGKKYKKCCGK